MAQNELCLNATTSRSKSYPSNIEMKLRILRLRGGTQYVKNIKEVLDTPRATGSNSDYQELGNGITAQERNIKRRAALFSTMGTFIQGPI